MIDKEKLAGIVGANNVIDDAAVLHQYSNDISFVNPVKPDLVVKPPSVDAIKTIVNIANETLTPLVPISSGFPHFHGDTVPSIGGSIIVDLSDMNHILRIDRINRVAMCEPGVNFGELTTALGDHGLRLNMPLLPRKSKSVLGSLLNREPVTMPGYHWDSSDPLDCVEVVFGTGDMFRTGSAAGPGTLEEQWIAGGAQDEPLGPGPISWHRLIQGAQGTMGIVTWATMRCELLPKLEEPFVFGSENIDQLLNLVHWLVRLRLVNECFILNSNNLSIINNKNTSEFIANKSDLPQWVLFFVVAGYDYFPQKRVNYQVKDIQDIFQKFGAEPQKAIGQVTADDLLQIIQLPSSEPYWKLRHKGACQDIFFLSDHDHIPSLIKIMQEAANVVGYPVPEIGIYLQPIVQGTSCHCEFNLFYDPEKRKEAELVKSLSTAATAKLMNNGAFFSRPYGENSNLIMNRDAMTVAVLKKVKNIFDPNKIMNPGKLCF